MPDERTVYASEAERYEALISREDYQHNIESAIAGIRDPAGLDIIDLGAGTGRLEGMLAPKAASMLGFDLSQHMLTVTRDKLRDMPGGRLLAAAADHRYVPVRRSSVDMVVSGWSVSYLAVWHPERWHIELDTWLSEMHRILRLGGTLILLESLGTGNEQPIHLPHLANFYAWLDEKGFENRWIRTDYRFNSVDEAAELAGFFFGEERAQKIRSAGTNILPECTGIWWKTLSAD
jgi:ubiquinone/menaquinone biosynthesis C-methylase UbiE